MNKEIVDKFIRIARTIEQEKGSLILFGLFERVDLPNKWDVLLSAKWVNSENKENFDYLAKKIMTELSLKELIVIERMVLLDASDNFVKAITTLFLSNFTNSEIRNVTFNNVLINHAYLIFSKK